MTLSILYLNPCRRERLRSAYAHTLQILGPRRAAAITKALNQVYQPENSPRINYNLSLHALQYVVGIVGLNAISLVKEAWNEGCLQATPQATLPTPKDQTHPTTNIPQ